LSFYLALSLHLLGAAVWVGGHLVLVISVLPDALRRRRASIVTEFEHRFERVGMPALALQVLTGLWLAERLLGPVDNWFDADPLARAVQAKLALLALTAALAAHARWRVIPRLTDDNLQVLAWHIRAVSLIGVLFVLVGASIRLGGYPIFTD
jgi:putative copper export protein